MKNISSYTDFRKNTANRTGLLFGSFNPVHTGHLIIGQYFAEFTDLEKIWFVVSPQNPFKLNRQLLPEEERLKLLMMAITGNPHFAACDIEFEMEKPSYTIHTLNTLEAMFPDTSFALIMGSDNLESLTKWKDYKAIISRFDIYAYPRPGYDTNDIPDISGGRIRIFDAPLIEISSSYIRQVIRNGGTPRYWLPDSVWQTIEKEGYYLEQG